METFSRKCATCGREIAAGESRCQECSSSSRPLLLAVLTSVVVVLGVLAYVVILVRVAEGRASEVQWVLPPVLAVPLDLAVRGLFVGLWFGKYWAWIGVQIVWSSRVVFMSVGIGRRCAAGMPVRTFIWPAISVIAALLLVAYVRRPSVRAFCSAAKSHSAGVHN